MPDAIYCAGRCDLTGVPAGYPPSLSAASGGDRRSSGTPADARPQGSTAPSGVHCPDNRSRHSVSSEYGSQASGMKESRIHAGLEDVIIFPLVLAALAAKNFFRAALLILIRILD